MKIDGFHLSSSFHHPFIILSPSFHHPFTILSPSFHHPFTISHIMLGSNSSKKVIISTILSISWIVPRPTLPVSTRIITFLVSPDIADTPIFQKPGFSTQRYSQDDKGETVKPCGTRKTTQRKSWDQ